MFSSWHQGSIGRGRPVLDQRPGEDIPEGLRRPRERQRGRVGGQTVPALVGHQVAVAVDDDEGGTSEGLGWWTWR